MVITDGYISAEKRVFTLIKKNLNNANLFSFGIGSSVNRYLIEGLAKAGKGEPFVVTKLLESAGVAKKFLSYIDSPVLTNISVDFDGFEAYAIEPPTIPDLLAQRPLQIMGKWRGKAHGKITVQGMTGEGSYQKVFPVSPLLSRPEHRPLRYLWARERVAALSDFNSIAKDHEAIQEVTSLGLTYELLTEYTSFVAVHDVIRNPAKDATTVKQPLPLPKGVSNFAVGKPSARTFPCTMSNSQPKNKVPEPDAGILLVVMTLLLLGSYGYRLRSRQKKA